MIATKASIRRALRIGAEYMAAHPGSAVSWGMPSTDAGNLALALIDEAAQGRYDMSGLAYLRFDWPLFLLFLAESVE